MLQCQSNICYVTNIHKVCCCIGLTSFLCLKPRDFTAIINHVLNLGINYRYVYLQICIPTAQVLVTHELEGDVYCQNVKKNINRYHCSMEAQHFCRVCATFIHENCRNFFSFKTIKCVKIYQMIQIFPNESATLICTLHLPWLHCHHHQPRAMTELKQPLCVLYKQQDINFYVYKLIRVCK